MSKEKTSKTSFTASAGSALSSFAPMPILLAVIFAASLVHTSDNTSLSVGIAAGGAAAVHYGVKGVCKLFGLQ